MLRSACSAFSGLEFYGDLFREMLGAVLVDDSRKQSQIVSARKVVCVEITGNKIDAIEQS